MLQSVASLLRLYVAVRFWEQWVPKVSLMLCVMTTLLSELQLTFSKNVGPVLEFTVIFQAVNVSLQRTQHRHQVAPLISIKKINR